MSEFSSFGGDGGFSAAPSIEFSSFGGGGFTSAPMDFSPTTSFDSGVSTPVCTGLECTPIAGYDNAAGSAPLARAEASTAEVPAAFKSDASAKYQTSDQLPAVASDRTKLGVGESPKINVGPVDESTPADVKIGKDGTVSLARGIADGDKPLQEYNVQVEDGADPRVTEKVLNDLAEMIKSKESDAVPRIESGKGADGQDLVSPEFKDQFREKFGVDGEGDELPDDPSLPDGGGDCGPGPSPGPGPNPDQLNPDELDDGEPDDSPIDGGDQIDGGAYSDRAFKALNELSSKMGDMHPSQYGEFMSTTFLPQEILDELGPPPWTPEQMAKLRKYLKEHQKEIQGRIKERASALEQQGDAESAKALNQFADDFEGIANDPQKLESFSTALGNFMERSQNGTANPTDVHALFDNNAGLEKAVRHSQLVEAAKDYDTSGKGGTPDLTKITSEKADKLIAELQLPPRKSVKGDEKKDLADPVSIFFDTMKK